MKRKLPDSMEIGGHKIQVLRVSNLLESQEAYGLFDPVNLRIEIDSSLSNTMAWETLWHEVVEAINFFSEAGLEHKSIQVFGLLLHQVANSIFTYKKSCAKSIEKQV